MTNFDSQWRNISEERLEHFERMFRWNEATAHYYDGAELSEGLQIADFGCGPGHQAIEFARRVGPQGHVHAFDINEAFLKRTMQRAQDTGLEDRISTYLLDSEEMRVPAETLDRVIVRNTLIHVPDPAANIAEFRRVLRSGGLCHMIEGDRRLMAVEPVTPEDWSALIDAAGWAWHQPMIGRKLYGLVRGAGFPEAEVRVTAVPDTEGRLLPMMQTIADYAREGSMEENRVAAFLSCLNKALADGTYMAVSPQFVVTAKA